MTSQHKSDWEERRDLATDDLGDVSDVLPPRPTLDGVEELLEFELKFLVRFEVDPVVVDPVPHRVQHSATHDELIHTSHRYDVTRPHHLPYSHWVVIFITKSLQDLFVDEAFRIGGAAVVEVRFRNVERERLLRKLNGSDAIKQLG